MANTGAAFLQRHSVVKFYKVKKEERNVLQFWKSPLLHSRFLAKGELMVRKVRGRTILVFFRVLATHDMLHH